MVRFFHFQHFLWDYQFQDWEVDSDCITSPYCSPDAAWKGREGESVLCRFHEICSCMFTTDQEEEEVRSAPPWLPGGSVASGDVTVELRKKEWQQKKLNKRKCCVSGIKSLAGNRSWPCHGGVSISIRNVHVFSVSPQQINVTSCSHSQCVRVCLNKWSETCFLCWVGGSSLQVCSVLQTPSPVYRLWNYHQPVVIKSDHREEVWLLLREVRTGSILSAASHTHAHLCSYWFCSLFQIFI